MNYAIVGCGRISPNHIEAARNNDLNIVALCDLDIDKAMKLKEQFSLENVQVYSNYMEMIEKEEVDLIAIATESGYHAKIAIDLIKEKKHLIIEKPIALSLEDAQEIIDLAKKYDVVVSACHQNRFNKAVGKLRDSIVKGDFGKLFHGTAHIRGNRGKEYYTQAPWRGTWENDGGALMNQCIHNIDLLRWMLGGEVTEVFSFTDNLNHSFIEAEDLGLALVKFKNGAYGVIEGTTNVYPRNLEETLYIFGETGTVKLGGKSVNQIDEWYFSRISEDTEKLKKDFSEFPTSVYGFGHTPLYKDVKNAIINSHEPYVTAKDGMEALELVLAIYKSSKEGKAVKLPLDKGSTREFKKGFMK